MLIALKPVHPPRARAEPQPRARAQWAVGRRRAPRAHAPAATKAAAAACQRSAVAQGGYSADV